MNSVSEYERVLKWSAVVASGIAVALGIVWAAVWAVARETFTLMPFP